MLQSPNRVLFLGPLVLKTIRGPRRAERVRSELLTRAFLRGSRIVYPPATPLTARAFTFLMPNMKRLGYQPKPPSPTEFATYLLGTLLPALQQIDTPMRFGWLATPEPAWTSFADFIEACLCRYRRILPELHPLSRHYATLLTGLRSEAVTHHPCLAPTDCSLKNTLRSGTTLLHLDFESTMLLPREAYLAQLALNLVRDANAASRPQALKAAATLAAHIESEATACAALAVALARMEVFAIAHDGSTDPLRRAFDALFRTHRTIPTLEALQR